MLRFISALWAALTLVTGAQAQSETIEPSQAFERLMGVWRTVGGVPQEDGSYTANVGVFIGEPAFLGGETPSILIRTYSMPEGEPGDNPFGIRYFESVSIFAFHAESGDWRGIGHNTLANRKWREVTLDGDAISYVQTGELFQEVQGQVRFTYYDITEDGFEMRVDYLAPDTDEWILGTYRMTARRIG